MRLARGTAPERRHSAACLRSYMASRKSLGSTMADYDLPQPQHMLRLRPRADHSNYVEREECRVRLVAVGTLIEESSPRKMIDEKRNDQLKHVQKTFVELEVIDNLENEALEAQRSLRIAFCAYDKLGSHWQFLPIPTNDRESKKTAKCRGVQTSINL
eukprot:6200168-Pleurochrysis_carterae.AAC.5